MNCLFKLRKKLGKEVVPIYDIKRDNSLEFLIYDNGIWRYSSAIFYEPIPENKGE